MKKNWKSKVAKATGGNQNIDRKVMKLKSSWDEVEGMLNGSIKTKKK
jgi:hypothetical protein